MDFPLSLVITFDRTVGDGTDGGAGIGGVVETGFHRGPRSWILEADEMHAVARDGSGDGGGNRWEIPLAPGVAGGEWAGEWLENRGKRNIIVAVAGDLAVAKFQLGQLQAGEPVFHGPGLSGRHGLWIRRNTHGKLIVRNSKIADERNESAGFTVVRE
jgi:hypothetical protein